MKAERLKEKILKQDFNYDMEEVFAPVTAKKAEATENQKQNQIQIKQQAEKQIQAPRESTQTTTQAIENQTRAIQESSQNLKKNYTCSIEKGTRIEKAKKDREYDADALTTGNNHYLTNLVSSNLVDSSKVKTVFNLLNDKNKVNLVWDLLKGVQLSSQLTPLILNKYKSKVEG